MGASDLILSLRWGAEYLKTVRPMVADALSRWRTKAEAIPDAVLRGQALSSLTEKQFHCEGGGVFAGPSRDPGGDLMQFLVPYQTLCDYLDTVTDRGPSQDPENLRWLHQSLLDAVEPGAPVRDYYRSHPQGEDGGYIADLVRQCQTMLRRFPGFSAIAEPVRRSVGLYIDLQVYKHGPVADRVEALTAWYRRHRGPETGLEWWEFAAATGSTLGLFALFAAARDPRPSPRLVDAIDRLYFPWLGALHILLDYFIDQEEDHAGGDLNFVTYYKSPSAAIDRIRFIYRRAVDLAGQLPDSAFHRYVARGLLGFYLADRKVRHQLIRSQPACSLLAMGGTVSLGVWLAARTGRAP